LSNLGYGSRREVAALVRQGRVEVENDQPPPAATTTKRAAKQSRLAADTRVIPSAVRVDGKPLDPRPPLTLLINKPAGYVVSSPDDPRLQGPSVYDLLPERFGRRKPFLGPAGRLDKATSGLLVLTDDGQLAHRVTSPKKVLWKEYEAVLDAPLAGEELARATQLFASGAMVLAGDDGSPSAGRPLLPARLEAVEGCGGATVRVRVCEGRYHQVRRMMAAVGREVVELRRRSVGGLKLGEEGGAGVSAVHLEPGEWRPATDEDLAALFSGGVAGGVEEEEEDEDDDDESVATAGSGSAAGAEGETEEEREMRRRARIDARRREKRRVAKADAAGVA